ncbi:MAG: DUF4935 domain-containing protein [Gomphosphaeria aponina SAG 52.96 = DSM 107014]|uniref:DUF4935 domain-containing protein n=1 Tax=Gomphosphaeria aponina SAG 52.96 = DSM 107014 TaxID=1521640 RepID=A0A941JN12_9CHRO|nr:DUF4935 domain-containing protein [Gomphosphaeria aponina SAG 52.96 = DSM 107014]
MVRLYIETNFLLSIATGRDSLAYNLLENPPTSVQIAIPSICCMEALSALEDEVKRRNRFGNELNLQISQLQRDTTSVFAQSLLFHLKQSIVENGGLINDVQSRLFQGLNLITNKAEIITLTNNMLEESLRSRLIATDFTDNLILQCILQDALLSNEVKVFLSGNVKEFGEVKNILHDFGIVKYFTNTQDFLRWLNSQSES